LLILVALAAAYSFDAACAADCDLLREAGLRGANSAQLTPVSEKFTKPM